MFIPENTVPAIKHGGGSVMLRGCFTTSVTCTLHIIDEIVKATSYQQLDV